ncbi:MAG: replicative DNA helicase, partial [Verrucomicrobium sp.]
MSDHSPSPDSPACSLPFSDEAEKGALSALLQDPADLLPDFASHLPEEAFYHPANRLVYETFQEMHRAGRPVEQISVVSYMMDKGLLDRIGGAVTIVDLATYYGAGLHYRYYLELLRTKLMLRRLIATCKQGLEAAYAHPPDGDVLETVGTLERSVAELRMQDEMAGEGATFKELVNGAVDRYEQAILNGGQLPGVSTGYRRLDYATGGLREGQVWTLGGGTSDGKSAFMQNVVHSLAQQNVSTCLYSLEMSDEENVDRFMSMHSGVPAQDFLYGLTNRQHMTAATHAASSLQKWPLVLRDVSGIS